MRWNTQLIPFPQSSKFSSQFHNFKECGRFSVLMPMHLYEVANLCDVFVGHRRPSIMHWCPISIPFYLSRATGHWHNLVSGLPMTVNIASIHAARRCCMNCLAVERR